MHIIYSYDCNVLRMVPRKGHVECLPLTLGTSKNNLRGGRKLTPSELKCIAQNHWRGRINKFTYLEEGKGYMA